MENPIRNTVKVLLLNDKREILLICLNDPYVTAPDGTHYNKAWFTIGGGIEQGENLEEAALREIYEEAGIAAQEIELGPVVWYGEFDLVLKGKLTHFKQSYIVAKTLQSAISLNNLMADEQAVVENLAWFSLDKIMSFHEPIYPILLPQYLPNIIAGNYPETIVQIDLTKKHKSKTT